MTIKWGLVETFSKSKTTELGVALSDKYIFEVCIINQISLLRKKDMYQNHVTAGLMSTPCQ